MEITFVIPVYNERETLEPLVRGIAEHVGPRTHRILFIDDGSTDGSYEKICELRERYPVVDVVPLRGNFGKSAALAAGFAACDSELVFTMDGDLQDDPKEIPRFLEKLEDSLDMVCGWKQVRHDPWHKTFPSRIYNRFVAWLFDLPIHDVNCGYKLMRGDVVKKLSVYGEMHRLIPVMAHNLNYRVGEISVEHHRRRYGKSKYGFERFTRGALDVLTVWFLGRYRHQPGHFFGKAGFAQILIGLLALIVGLIDWFSGWSEAVGAALFVVGLVFGAIGFIMVCLGLLAELVLRHFVRIDPALYTVDDRSDKGERRRE